MALCTVEEATRRCCAAAGSSFEADTTWLRSSAVSAELPRLRNPGADDTEWICTVVLEGTPQDIGRQLAAIHAALARPPAPPTEDADNFSGFTV